MEQTTTARPWQMWVCPRSEKSSPFTRRRDSNCWSSARRSCFFAALTATPCASTAINRRGKKVPGFITAGDLLKSEIGEDLTRREGRVCAGNPGRVSCTIKIWLCLSADRQSPRLRITQPGAYHCEQNCKPGSVFDSHLSRRTVAGTLQPPRERAGQAPGVEPPAPIPVLLRIEFTATDSLQPSGALLPHLSTLTSAAELRW